MSSMLQPTILLLREGTDTSQGEASLIAVMRSEKESRGKRTSQERKKKKKEEKKDEEEKQKKHVTFFLALMSHALCQAFLRSLATSTPARLWLR